MVSGYSRGSVVAQRRQEAYQRLASINADRLRLGGYSVIYIAGQADTTEHFVHRWLQEVAGRDTNPAQTTRPSDAGRPSQTNAARLNHHWLRDS